MNSARANGRSGLLVMSSLVMIVATACDTHYVAAPAIDCNVARILPENAVVLAGSSVVFSCVRPSDKDTAYTIRPLDGSIKWDSPRLVQDKLADANHWPKWEANGGSIIGDSEGVTSIIWQAPDSAGTATIRFRDDDLPLPVDANSGDTGDRDDDGVNPAASLAVSVVVPEVVSVGWPSYTMHARDPNKSEWDDSSVPLHYPQYDPPHEYTSACLKMGTSVTITETCRVDQPISRDTSFVLKAPGDFDFDEAEAFFGSGSTSTSSSHPGVTDLPNEIYAYRVGLNWKYKVPTGSDNWIDMNSTDSGLCLTYGAPGGSCVTEKRVARACWYARGESEPNAIAEAIFWSLTDYSYDLDAPVDGPTPIWLLYDGEQAQCPGVATFVGVHFSMVGLPNWERRFCYAVPDIWFLDPNHPLNQYATASYRNDSWVPDTPERDPTLTVAHPTPTAHDDRGEPEYLLMVDYDGEMNNYGPGSKRSDSR